MLKDAVGPRFIATPYRNTSLQGEPWVSSEVYNKAFFFQLNLGFLFCDMRKITSIPLRSAVS